jgi:hypothetical protein
MQIHASVPNDDLRIGVQVELVASLGAVFAVPHVHIHGVVNSCDLLGRNPIANLDALEFRSRPNDEALTSTKAPRSNRPLEQARLPIPTLERREDGQAKAMSKPHANVESGTLVLLAEENAAGFLLERGTKSRYRSR